MNPPFAMMNDFVIKAKKEEIHGVCVFPMWSEEKWFEELLAASTSQIILMPPLRQNIFVNPAIGWVNPRRIPTWEVGIVTFNFNTKSVTKKERKRIENSEEDEKWSKKTANMYTTTRKKGTPQNKRKPRKRKRMLRYRRRKPPDTNYNKLPSRQWNN
jgi:hypothetical protein